MRKKRDEDSPHLYYQQCQDFTDKKYPQHRSTLNAEPKRGPIKTIAYLI